MSSIQTIPVLPALDGWRQRESKRRETWQRSSHHFILHAATGPPNPQPDRVFGLVPFDNYVKFRLARTPVDVRGSCSC